MRVGADGVNAANFVIFCDQRPHDVGEQGFGIRRLHDHADAARTRKFCHIFYRFDTPSARHVTDGSGDFWMIRVADDDDFVTFGFKFFSLPMNFRDHRACRVDNLKALGFGFLKNFYG